MATANANQTIRSGPPRTASSATGQARRRRWPRVVLILLVALLAVLAFYWTTIMAYARTGASYGARVACSCRYEGGRGLDDCRKDFEPGMGMITLSEDSQAKSVTARFPLLARQTATYRAGWGCVLEKWED